MDDGFDMSEHHIHTRVARLERAVKFLPEQLHLEYEDKPETSYPEVAQLKQQGKVIAAIQLFRSKTGASLAEAKNVVDALKV
jgi:ribosomal protein L7/L12